MTTTMTREEKRQAFGEGPWLDEPDRHEWRTFGLPCLVRRTLHGFGTLCGYVALPPGHPWHGLGLFDVPARVHGGVTYAEPCDHEAEVCHTPQLGESDGVWWVGFDCGHANDYKPRMAEQLRDGFGEIPRALAGGVYRSWPYVVRQTRWLALQASAAPTIVETSKRLERARSHRQRKQAQVFASLAICRAYRRLPREG